MYNIFCSAIASILGFSLGFFVLENLWTGVFFALLGFGICFFLMNRFFNKKIQIEMLQIQKDLQRGPSYVGAAVDKMIDLKSQYEWWQPLFAKIMDGQIGTLLFMQQKYKAAEPYLNTAWSKSWQAKAMLAILQYKRKDFTSMNETMTMTSKTSPKQGLMWSLWGYLNWKAGNKDEAIRVLAQGEETLGEKDPYLKQNLRALQNGKKMKMKGYGDPWYQFQLETHPALQKAQRGRMRYRA